jgi:hypothetical protein
VRPDRIARWQQPHQPIHQPGVLADQDARPSGFDPVDDDLSGRNVGMINSFLL